MAERQQQVHAKLGRYLNPKSKQSLTHVERSTKGGATERLVLKEDMEDALLEHHQEHFSQAQGTPFTHPYLEDLLGYNTEKEASQRFRDGRLRMVPYPN